MSNICSNVEVCTVARGITPNGKGLAKAGDSQHKSPNKYKSPIIFQKFNKPLLPRFCQANVGGSAFILIYG
ncbi:MAG: hypothetical protein EAZ53_03220 [Bacteroidetes bacterium]|nr:MAG: hypothetical protein EAZ53_03220 [Bacteroidota bacterium]